MEKKQEEEVCGGCGAPQGQGSPDCSCCGRCGGNYHFCPCPID